MRPLSKNRIHSFRTITGRPKRSVVGPHASHKSVVHAIRTRAAQLSPLSTKAFSQRANDFREDAIGQPSTSTGLVVEAFAQMTEALRRSLGITYYDVQLLGGLAMAAGALAEIQTGEGKTVTTALPAYLRALRGNGVHVSTTSEYLSRRDYEELRPAFQLLGLRVGLLEPCASPAAKAEAYNCDITYGPGYEFGFDFLREQVQRRNQTDDPLGLPFLNSQRAIELPRDRYTQRELASAIVDEADSVLLDDATTPLVLSHASPAAEYNPSCLFEAMQVAESLELDKDFRIERNAIAFTGEGWDKCYAALNPKTATELPRPWSTLVNNALRAKHILKNEVDYVVSNKKVLIVDANTRRIHQERSWQNGLHQAVEVVAGLEPSREQTTQAKISRQKFSQFYEHYCGTTGTARGSELEFQQTYDMPVVEIPTNRPSLRLRLANRFFVTTEQKHEAIVEDVLERRKTGQPILLGTRSIQESKTLSLRLSQAGVSHSVLNGLQDRSEAEVVAQAGQANRVTVATNMAGRGTDIRLDQNVKTLGGLHVIATQFHESSRIDRQLMGRSARQGDPGSCQMFAAADDDVFRSAGKSIQAKITRLADENGECRKDLTSTVRDHQAELDRQQFSVRRELAARDVWMESGQKALAARSG